MYSHTTLGTNNVTRAAAFYDRLMAILGHERFFFDAETGIGYGDLKGEQFWIVAPFDGERATAGNGVHIAFLTQDRATVEAFHEAALEEGGEDEGQPGLRAQYHPNYFGAYVRDPEGNKLQAVCHKAE